MSFNASKQADQQGNSESEDRERARRKRALSADPDVASPESGDTSTEGGSGSGGP